VNQKKKIPKHCRTPLHTCVCVCVRVHVQIIFDFQYSNSKPWYTKYFCSYVMTMAVPNYFHLSLHLTAFTQMQGCSKMTPKTDTSAKQKCFAINLLHLIQKACQIRSTFTSLCHCLHFHSQCLLLPHTHTHMSNNRRTVKMWQNGGQLSAACPGHFFLEPLEHIG